MDSKTRPSDQTMSNNKADMNREVNVITDETCSFEGNIAETVFRALNDASESSPENTANGYHEKNSTPAIKYDGNLNELPIQGLMDDRGMHDAKESREMKVVVDMDNLGESSRPQSPVRHRKNCSTRPIGDLLDTREANGNLSSTHSLLPLQSLDELGRRPGTAGNQACSGIQINEMISMEEDIKKPIELVMGSSKIPFQPETKAPTPFSQKLVITSTPEPLESDLPSMRYPAPASLPVTLLGVSTDLRRKRIKKVSNYIIGALLGEGTYGVVRDGLDISGERILRCAVKMCNVSSGSTTGAKERPALKRTDHAAYLRQVTRRETANLQRFHSPYIVRAHDIFTMNGKEYIILPIAICSLEQLVQYARQGASAKPPATISEVAPPPAAADDGVKGLNPSASPAEETISTVSYHSGSTQDYRGPLRGRHPGGEDPNNALHLSDEAPSAPTSGSEDSRSVSFSVTSCSSTSSASRSTGALTNACTSFHTEAPRDAGSHLSSPFLNPEDEGSRSFPQHSGPPQREPEPLLSAMLIRGIMFQILSGVNYLHLQNSAHNDIKTSNVLLFEDGSVKLTDLGSVGEHYEGYGTPLYTAPELCKHFYGLLKGHSSDDEKNSGMKEGDLDGERGNVAARGQGPRNQRLFGIDAKKCDMWCCGLVLYKLLTGKDGPLPVHQKNYSGRYKDPNSDLDDNGVTPLSPINCFQLYYEIASQEKPVYLDDLPDLIIETVGAARVPVNGFAGKYPPNSVRNLLEGLLAIDPDKRLTSQEALAHPWITSLLEIIQASSGLRRPPSSHEHGGQRGSAWRSVEEAIRRGIAHEVLQSRQVRKILKRDNESHLQFVADCCNILNVNIPDEVFKPFGTEPYENNYYSGMWGRGVSVPRPQSSSAVPTAADGEGRAREAVMGTLVRPNLPRVMPRGCVDPHLFLPFDEANYYERKSGKKGFDVRCLLGQPSKVARLEEYLHNVVLVKCGYRDGPDPAFEAAARGALGFLPRLRYHLGSLGSEVGCLYSTPSQSIAPTMVFRSGQPRGSPSGEASSRSLLLPHVHEDSKHGGARGSTSTTALRPQPTQGREGERQHIAAGIVMTSGPPGNTGRRGGGDAGTQRGAANEARQIINRQRVTSGVYQGSEREGIEAAAESSKCFCGLG